MDWEDKPTAEPHLYSKRSQLPNPVSIPFGDRIELAGFRIPKRLAKPNEELMLTFFWYAHAKPKHDYKISIQIRDEAGTTVAQRDDRPADGSRKTLEWSRGDIIEDLQPLTIFENAPPGDYRIFVTFYDEETGQKLLVDWRNSELDLGPFRVIESP